jgi:hypothetical protein
LTGCVGSSVRLAAGLGKGPIDPKSVGGSARDRSGLSDCNAFATLRVSNRNVSARCPRSPLPVRYPI